MPASGFAQQEQVHIQHTKKIARLKAELLAACAAYEAEYGPIGSSCLLRDPPFPAVPTRREQCEDSRIIGDLLAVSARAMRLEDQSSGIRNGSPAAQHSFGVGQTLRNYRD